ncbi:MAG TPA: hypothetical protein VFR23_13870 [Jiangellaceae bacterium]|nr:hypothetical protein [Jiangellaceae bacterium]
MSTLLDRVPLERITTEAREVHVGRTLATLIAGLLYLVGWVAARVFAVVWFGVAWSATAVKVGWEEARKPAGGG